MHRYLGDGRGDGQRKAGLRHRHHHQTSRAHRYTTAATLSVYEGRNVMQIVKFTDFRHGLRQFFCLLYLDATPFYVIYFIVNELVMWRVM